METLKHINISEKTKARTLRFSAVAAAALTLAACSGNMPQRTETLAQEIHQKSAKDGRQYIAIFIVKGIDQTRQDQLEENGGVFVRAGAATTQSPSYVIGMLTPGVRVHGADIFDSGDGTWAAISCLNPAIDKAGYYHENTDLGGFKAADICYVNTNFVEPIK